MIVNGNDTIRDVKGISKTEKQRIFDFLQGAIYCWCNNYGDKEFSARDFVGGENREWKNMPIQVLYNKNINDGKNYEEAFKQAGIDLGNLLKQVIKKDERSFNIKEGFPSAKYCWVKTPHTN